MPPITTTLIMLVVFSSHHHYSHAQRIKDKMYEEIDGISACFRRLNGTHQFGCSSEREGSTGVIHFIETLDDLNVVFTTLTKNGLRYVPAIPVSFFTPQLNHQLHTNTHIAGLLMYEANETLTTFSHDEQCPNSGANIAGTCMKTAPWNAHGSGLSRQDIRFPIFYLNAASEIDKVRGCFQQFNNFSFQLHAQRSLCAIEMKSFMFAAHDTPTCLRRSQSMVNFNPMKFCDPLGDQNVWASLFPIGNVSNASIHLSPTLKHILVVARMDTTSLFHAMDPGAQSSVSSLVTLLAVAELLKRMLPVYKSYERNVLFVVFNGESYDYIGSQRLVFDIQKGAFPQRAFDDGNEQVQPIRMDDIEVVLELNQINNKSPKGKLYFHQLANDTREYYELLKATLDVDESPVGRLPPTSVQSFAREENSPPLLVLSGYNMAFTNPFYNAIYDTATHLNYTYMNTSMDALLKDTIQMYLARVAEGVAQSLYTAVTKTNYTGKQVASVFYVNELLHCYLENANCSIHRTLRRATFQAAPLDLYVGVTVQPNVLTNLVALTFVYLMGDVAEGPCGPSLHSHVFYQFNMSSDWSDANATRCYRASMNLTDAESPAFIIENYDWTSGRYSSWSESVWREFHVRIFLQPARSHEIMTVTIGALVCLLAVAVTLFINAKKDVLFTAIATTTPPANC